MVEFALVFMLLFTIITLIAEGGFLFSTWLAATNGAREGARFGAPCLNRSVDSCDATDITNVVNARTAGFLDQSSGYSVAVDTSSAYSVTVVVKATASTVAPILGDIPVYGQATMRLENSPPS